MVLHVVGILQGGFPKGSAFLWAPLPVRPAMLQQLGPGLYPSCYLHGQIEDQGPLYGGERFLLMLNLGMKNGMDPLL